MKKLGVFILFAFAMLLSANIFAQTVSDTIVTKYNEDIVCKITKITDSEIEYKKSAEADAIVYVISKDKVLQIRYANGTVEVIKRDEMDMNAEYEILDKRQAIKFHFFSPFRDYLAFTYEKSIKMGTNLELSAGYINTSMFKMGLWDEYDRDISGAFFGGGAKFNLGNSYYMKGMKYSHPLKGKYFKPEIMYTGYTVQNLEYNITTGTYPYQTDSTYISNKHVNSISIMLNYGNQYILGNVMTFGFSFGIGYSIGWSSYTNQGMVDAMNQSNNYFYDLWDYDANMFNHVRTGGTNSLAFSSTITLGYIFK